MPKTLKDFLEVYKPKSPDEQKFVDKHVVIKHKDRNGNGDDVFNAAKIKTGKRKEERHGYDAGEDEKVYEALKGDQHKIDANKNGKVDAHDFHLLRKKKKVAEETEELEELSIGTMKSYGDKRARTAFSGGRKPGQSVDAGIKMKSKQSNSLSLARTKINRARDTGSTVLNKEEVSLEDLLDEALELLSAVAEGTMPTADEPTDANKKTAQRIRDLLAKEKKPVKEETEELDESAKIAAHLIKRYGDNVRKSHVVSAANDFGVDASKLAKAVRTKLGKTSLAEEDDGWYTHSQIHGSMKSEKHPKGISAAEWKSGIRWHHGKNKRINIKEEVEAIDELSTKLATNYTAVASDASRQKNLSTAKQDKRYKSMALAHEKIRARHAQVPTTEEVEAIDELSKGAMLNYLSANKKSDKAAQEKGDYSKSVKRMRGTDVAVRKYTAGPNSKYVRVAATEEVEELDELSKATMGSYINKAAERIGTKGVSAGLRIAADEKSSKNFKDMGKRQKGIARAVGKLTKEDIINRTIEKYVPEDLKFTPEERLLKRLNGLSEAHINTMLGLFEDLNKDNQNKMIETVSTEAGINQILNFVLENRGK